MGELTVGQLRKLIDNYSDDTKIIAVSDNYELKRSLVDAYVFETKAKKVRRDFIDDFDRTPYSTDVYTIEDDGEDVIIIKG